MFNVAEVPGDGNLHDDAASDITPTDTRNAKTNGRTTVEKTIKFRFLPKNRSSDAVHPSLVHSQWIREVQEALGGEIEIFDNKGKALPKVDLLRWTKDQHLKTFNLHSHQSAKTNPFVEEKTLIGREKTVFIAHRIRTSWSLTEIKSIAAVNKLLKEHNVFMTEHRWPETIWNTTQLGFIIGLDPQFFDPEQAVAKVIQDLQKNTNGHPKIPKFRMAYTTPSIETNEHRQLRTKAYAIETEKSSSMEMLRYVKQAYKDTGLFVPFQMRSKLPEIFAKAIRMQTAILASHRTIVLNNIGTDAMMYLSHWIEQIDGVKEIAPYKSVDHDGRYRILVKKEEFHNIRSHISRQLPEWYENHVAPDAHPHHRRFPGQPGVAPIHSDDFSSREGSYMATSINTVLIFEESMANVQPHQTESKEQTRASLTNNWKTWADRAAAKPTVTSSQPTNATNIPSANAIRADLAERQAEVEALKREVQVLKLEREHLQATIDKQVEEKVTLALKEKLSQINATPSVPNSQFEELLAIQKQSFQEFSSHMMQMMHIQRLEMMAAFQHGTVAATTGKRSGATTSDTSSMTESYQGANSEDRKRLDTKPTPTKKNYRHENREQETRGDASPNVVGRRLPIACLVNNIPQTSSKISMEPPNSPMELPMMDLEETGAPEGQEILDNKSSVIVNNDITVEANRHTEWPTVAKGFITESKPGCMPESGYSTPRRNDV
jgi:hypothetical protein